MEQGTYSPSLRLRVKQETHQGLDAKIRKMESRILVLIRFSLPFQLWNRYQTHLPKKNRSTVVYGHDSRRGLQLTPYTKGLDTGCVRGGRLTALVIGNDKSEERGPMTYSVECKDYRSLAAQQSEKLGGMGQS